MTEIKRSLKKFTEDRKEESRPVKTMYNHENAQKLVGKPVFGQFGQEPHCFDRAVLSEPESIGE